MPQQPMGIESYLASGAQERVLSGRAGVRAERQGAGPDRGGGCGGGGRGGGVP